MPIFKSLQAKYPNVASDIADRFATAKIRPDTVVAKVWPEIERELVANGDQAEISDLLADVRAADYEFSGTRQRKPKAIRRPIRIQAAAPQ